MGCERGWLRFRGLSDKLMIGNVKQCHKRGIPMHVAWQGRGAGSTVVWGGCQFVISVGPSISEGVARVPFRHRGKRGEARLRVSGIDSA